MMVESLGSIEGACVQAPKITNPVSRSGLLVRRINEQPKPMSTLAMDVFIAQTVILAFLLVMFLDGPSPKH
jgi:hypothetical protein